MPKGKTAHTPSTYITHVVLHALLRQTDEMDIDLLLFQTPINGGSVATVDIQPAKK